MANEEKHYFFSYDLFNAITNIHSSFSNMTAFTPNCHFGSDTQILL